MRPMTESMRRDLELHKMWINGEEGGVRLDWSGRDLRNMDLRKTDLRGANIRQADLRRADLCRTDLRWASLCETNFSGADLRGADLCMADLRRTDLRSSDLTGTHLTRLGLKVYGKMTCIASQIVGHVFGVLGYAAGFLFALAMVHWLGLGAEVAGLFRVLADLADMLGPPAAH